MNTDRMTDSDYPVEAVSDTGSDVDSQSPSDTDTNDVIRRRLSRSTDPSGHLVISRGFVPADRSDVMNEYDGNSSVPDQPGGVVYVLIIHSSLQLPGSIESDGFATALSSSLVSSWVTTVYSRTVPP